MFYIYFMNIMLCFCIYMQYMSTKMWFKFALVWG